MANIDIQYHKLLKEILENGYNAYDKSRKTNTKQISSYTLDLRNQLGIPIITTKKIFYKSVFAELMFFLRGENNIKFLIDRNCNIWNQDAYSYYKRLCLNQKITTQLGFNSFIDSIKSGEPLYMISLPKDYKLGDLGPVYGIQWHRRGQLIECIKRLSNKDFNRRLLVNGWNVDELDKMALPPCHWAYEFLQEKDGFVLKWHQRSVDTFLGLPFNILSYYTLGKIVQLISGLPFYGLIGDLSNVHIYQDHIEAVKEQLSNDPYKYSTRNVRFAINLEHTRNIHSYLKGNINLEKVFEELDFSKLNIVGYQSFPPIKAEMTAPII